MSGGLLALLDDVVALTKVAAASLDDAAGQAAQASTQAAGVVIDDAAVTPRYVVGFAAKRELPIIGRIAYGSLKNKLVYLLPVALLLRTFAPWAITPLLMLGGLYLCFEGYEKVHHMLSAHTDEPLPVQAETLSGDEKVSEDKKIASAIRTDFILSAEIMAIALASVTAPDLITQAVVLAVVAVLVTALVYGVVALIVKADDFGLYLAQRDGTLTRAIGRGLVHGMPPFLKVLSFVGTLAMLWVGGAILVHGLNEFGWSGPEHIIHAVSEGVRAAVDSIVPVFSGFLAWLTTATGSAIVGLIAGALTAFLIVPALEPILKAMKPAK